MELRDRCINASQGLKNGPVVYRKQSKAASPEALAVYCTRLIMQVMSEGKNCECWLPRVCRSCLKIIGTHLAWKYPTSSVGVWVPLGVCFFHSPCGLCKILWVNFVNLTVTCFLQSARSWWWGWARFEWVTSEGNWAGQLGVDPSDCWLRLGRTSS